MVHATAVEVVPLGRSGGVAGAAVPVATGLGTCGPGFGLDIATASPSVDDGSTGSLGHGEGGATSAVTKRRTILLNAIVENALVSKNKRC